MMLLYLTVTHVLIVLYNVFFLFSGNNVWIWDNFIMNSAPPSPPPHIYFLTGIGCAIPLGWVLLTLAWFVISVIAMRLLKFNAEKRRGGGGSWRRKGEKNYTYRKLLHGKRTFNLNCYCLKLPNQSKSCRGGSAGVKDWFRFDCVRNSVCRCGNGINTHTHTHTFFF